MALFAYLMGVRLENKFAAKSAGNNGVVTCAGGNNRSRRQLGSLEVLSELPLPRCYKSRPRAKESG